MHLHPPDWVTILDGFWATLRTRRCREASTILQKGYGNEPYGIVEIVTERAHEVDQVFLGLLRAYSPDNGGRAHLYEADIDLLIAVEHRIEWSKRYIGSYPANQTFNVAARFDELGYLSWVLLHRMVRGEEAWDYRFRSPEDGGPSIPIIPAPETSNHRKGRPSPQGSARPEH